MKTKTKTSSPDPKGDPVGFVKEARKVRRELQDLSDAILLFADAVDAAFMKDQTVPPAAGGKLARLLTALDVQNDRVRYFTLGVDYRTDNKPAAVARLRAKAGRRGPS